MIWNVCGIVEILLGKFGKLTDNYSYESRAKITNSLKMVTEIELKEFFKGKKVFLTGHTGFKGGWIALWLNDMGAKVHGFSLSPSSFIFPFRDSHSGDILICLTLEMSSFELLGKLDL